MSYLYVTDQGSKLSINANKIVSETKDGEVKNIPIEVVEGVFVFGNISITTPLIQELLRRDIPVTFLSTKGKYFGKLESTRQNNVVKQAYQFRALYDKDFCLKFSKKIINAKTNNQLNIIRRFSRGRLTKELDSNINKIIKMRNRILDAESKEKLLGVEGIIAKYYFSSLGMVTPSQFCFKKRSKMPPKDPFNSLLSFGYTILMYEIYNDIVASGLSPYLGIFHKIRDHHPALASDLMEELRAVLIDSLCLNLVIRNMIRVEGFSENKKGEGIYIEKESIKKYILKYEEKIRTSNTYYSFENRQEISYRSTLSHQVKGFFKAVKEKNADLYSPLIIK